MIASFKDILDEQRARQAAVGAFTCYDTTTASGVLRAAEAAGVPVILLVSNGSFAGHDGERLLAALLALAENTAVPACVQLDHVSDLPTIARAIGCGVGAVMADGSRLPFADNVELARQVARIARPEGVGVEVELGHIEGGEDVALATHAGAYTNPVEAARFARDCEIDCLAVSIGNVHGAYAAPPSLDWSLLGEIQARLEIPLSLHGASGLPAADVQTAVASGIAKVNVNAELRRRAFRELETLVPRLVDGYRMLELQAALATAAAEVAAETLALLAPPP